MINKIIYYYREVIDNMEILVIILLINFIFMKIKIWIIIIIYGEYVNVDVLHVDNIKNILFLHVNKNVKIVN